MKVLVFLAGFMAVLILCGKVPDNFDARDNWNQCEMTVLNQGGCGSCWDFCASEAFADRLCINGEAPSGTIISPQTVLDCVHANGCNGGNEGWAWGSFMTDGGTTCTDACTSGCEPYISGSTGLTYQCPNSTCSDGSPWPVTYYAADYAGLHNSPHQIQTELYNNGPLQASFWVFENFNSFFSANPTGIYTTHNGSVLGGHCVKLIGWGIEGEQEYWILQNSWGLTFADGGFFKMAKGINLCGIENSVTEGFTQAQVRKGGPFLLEGLEVPPGEKAILGGWTHQSSSDPFFADVAKIGLELVSKKQQREFTLDSIVTADTQVVAGTNFKFLVKTLEGPTISMKLFRNLHYEFELVDFDLEK